MAPWVPSNKEITFQRIIQYELYNVIIKYSSISTFSHYDTYELDPYVDDGDFP
jgi:hypothetical protein